MALLPGTARAQRHQAAALLHVDEERGSAFFSLRWNSPWLALARCGRLGCWWGSTALDSQVDDRRSVLARTLALQGVPSVLTPCYSDSRQPCSVVRLAPAARLGNTVALKFIAMAFSDIGLSACLGWWCGADASFPVTSLRHGN